MKKFLGFVCIIYSLIIIYVWYFDKIKLFLAPQMSIYLKASLIPLLIMELVLIFIKHTSYKFKLFDIFLLLPLVMLLLAGNGKLSSNFAMNRMKSYSYEESNVKEKKEESKKEETFEEIDASLYDFNNPDFEVVDANYDSLAGYITFMPDKAVKYIGKTIKVKGFATLDSPMFTSDYFIIGKYTISCCAADASYTGFIVRKNSVEITKDKWYEIEGVLSEGVNVNDDKVVVINPVNIKEIDSKYEEQYVYPCYSYDGGECKEVKKYNLEY